MDDILAFAKQPGGTYLEDFLLLLALEIAIILPPALWASSGRHISRP